MAINSRVMINIDELNPYVRKAGKQDRSSWKNKSRRIYDHELLYCLEGRAHIVIENRSYNIRPGTIVLIKPDRPHSYWLEEDEAADVVWVHFDYIFRTDVYNLIELLAGGNSFLYDAALPKKTFIRPEPVFENGFVFPELFQTDTGAGMEKGFFSKAFTEILDTFQRQDELWQLDCKILLLQVLKALLRLCRENGGAASCRVKKGTTAAIAGFVANYIEKNCHRSISVGEAARAAGLNEDYLGKLFKKETGENFTGFVNRVRVNRAKELLLQTDLNISDIAEMTGFNDVYYFCKVMKKYEGLSPAVWRRSKA